MVLLQKGEEEMHWGAPILFSFAVYGHVSQDSQNSSIVEQSK